MGLPLKLDKANSNVRPHFICVCPFGSKQTKMMTQRACPSYFSSALCPLGPIFGANLLAIWVRADTKRTSLSVPRVRPRLGWPTTHPPFSSLSLSLSYFSLFWLTHHAAEEQAPVEARRRSPASGDGGAACNIGRGGPRGGRVGGSCTLLYNVLGLPMPQGSRHTIASRLGNLLFGLPSSSVSLP